MLNFVVCGGALSCFVTAVLTSVMSWWLHYRCFIAICKCFLYWNCSRRTFWSPEMWLLEGPRGPQKIFSRLATARHILRPPHKLCCNSTTDPYTPYACGAQRALLPVTAPWLFMMYATDVRQHHRVRVMPPPIRGGGIITNSDDFDEKRF